VSQPVLNQAAAQALADCVNLAITANEPVGGPAVLSAGTWLVVSDVACRFLQGPSNVAMGDNSTKGNYLPANQFYPRLLLVTAAADKYVDARATGAGSGNITFTLLSVPQLMPTVVQLGT
jgi:hypothetical protein